MQPIRIRIENEAAMLSLGHKLGETAPKNLTIYLTGELGAGKTTLTRGFLRGMGYTGAVKSPTYTLVESYEVNRKLVYHFDLYRIVDPEELSFIGIEEYFSTPAIRLLEWPEKGNGWINSPDLSIDILFTESSRELVLFTKTKSVYQWIVSIDMSEFRTSSN